MALQIGRKQQEATAPAPTRKAVRRADWQSDRKKNQVGVDDMTLLSTLSNEAISDNLSKRFAAQKIYTYIGNVLISVNPFRDLGIYTDEILYSYVDRTLIEAPPHVYAVAESAVHRMRSFKENQCVIISGESGAGKTEAAKKIMQYIASVCTKSSPGSSGATANASSGCLDHVRDMILATNPLLESFGNAKTLRNNNSSRFGKYIELYFNSEAQPVGAKISNYLLEKSRVVSQSKNERNFHIFYQLCKALSSSPAHRDLHLAGPENFAFTSQAGCLSADGIDDVREHSDVINACNVIGITEVEQRNIMCILSALLWLGEIKFSQSEQDADHAVVRTHAPLETVSRLLGIPAEEIANSMTARSIVTPGGERIPSPLNMEQAGVVRDALAKVIYERLFDWIVERVNKAMKPVGNDIAHTIGILDIYGFEIFELNSFEQLCINFVNEKLQQIFIELTLKAEQEDYVDEGINWTPIEYFDNRVVCELIEGKRKPGIMAIMNDVCARIHADSDKADVQLGKQLTSLEHTRFSASDGDFTVRHYAGDVRYAVAGMCEKNRDQTNKDLVEAIKLSQNALLQVLFPEQVDWENRQRPVPASEKIRTSAAELVTTLMTCHPNYIRCLKPNESKSPREYNTSICTHQIKYLGLLQNVKVRRAGFASRQTAAVFLERYYLLTPSTCKDGECTWMGDVRSGAKTILMDAAVPTDQWQIGKSKVFIKSPETLFLLEEMREQFWHRMAARVQRWWRAHFVRMARAAGIVQEYWRDYAGNNALVQMRDFGTSILNGRKERRYASMSSRRRYYGDYLDFSQVMGAGMRAVAGITAGELIVFTMRVQVPIFRLMRATKMSPRVLVLTDSLLRVLVTKENKKTGEVEQSVEKRVQLSDLTGITMSPFADGFVVLHVRKAEDVVVDVPFKTELCAFITYQCKTALEITSEIQVFGEGGKKLRTMAFVRMPTCTGEPTIKGIKVSVSPGLPSNSQTRPSAQPRNTNINIKININGNGNSTLNSNQKQSHGGGSMRKPVVVPPMRLGYNTPAVTRSVAALASSPSATQKDINGGTGSGNVAALAAKNSSAFSKSGNNIGSSVSVSSVPVFQRQLSSTVKVQTSPALVAPSVATSMSAVPMHQALQNAAMPTRPMPALPPAPKMTHVALYDIDGVEDGELTVKKSAELAVTIKGDTGWWFARNTAGDEGWVPASYLKEL